MNRLYSLEHHKITQWAWKGPLEVIWSNLPLASMATQSQLHGTTSRWLLTMSKDRDSTISQGNLCQCSVTSLDLLSAFPLMQSLLQGQIPGSCSSWCPPGSPDPFLRSYFPAGQPSACPGAWGSSHVQDFALLVELHEGSVRPPSLLNSTFFHFLNEIPLCPTEYTASQHVLSYKKCFLFSVVRWNFGW